MTLCGWTLRWLVLVPVSYSPRCSKLNFLSRDRKCHLLHARLLAGIAFRPFTFSASWIARGKTCLWKRKWCCSTIYQNLLAPLGIRRKNSLLLLVIGKNPWFPGSYIRNHECFGLIIVFLPRKQSQKKKFVRNNLLPFENFRFKSSRI